MKAFVNRPRWILLLALAVGSAGCSNRYDDIEVCVMYPTDVQAAIDACTRLIDKPRPVDPDRYGWFVARGNHKLKANDVRGALADFDASIRLRPDDPQLYETRADAHRRLGDDAAAVRDLQRAMELERQAASEAPAKP